MHDHDIALIPLYARDGSIRAYATVDTADSEWVGQWRWYLSSEGYATRTESRGRRHSSHQFKLHRELLGLVLGDGLEGDHINRIKLDNRRSNLRALPQKGRPQMQNLPGKQGSSSRFRGVSWDKARGKWEAYMSVDRRRHHLGRFSSEHDAAEAARAARAALMPYAWD